MIRRYELGPRVDLPVETPPPKLADVAPSVKWADDRSSLLLEYGPYDPAVAKPPAEVRVYAIPEGSTLFGATADAIVADTTLSFSVLPIEPAPAGTGGAPLVVLLPTYPAGVVHVGQVVYAFDDPTDEAPGVP